MLHRACPAGGGLQAKAITFCVWAASSAGFLPGRGQNTGYDDFNRHKYWHFVDMPFSQEGTNVTSLTIPTPDAQTQIAGENSGDRCFEKNPNVAAVSRSRPFQVRRNSRILTGREERQ